MPSDQSHVTNRLAQFVAGSQWETIPPEVRREGIRGLLNFVGCALGGSQDEAMGIAVKVLTPWLEKPSNRETLRTSALQGLAVSEDPAALDLLVAWTKLGKPPQCRRSAIIRSI